MGLVALTRILARRCASTWALRAALASWALAIWGFAFGADVARAADPPVAAPTRIEARSSTLLAVGIAQGGHMAIHLSRLLDNAPVRDVVVTVLLRGVAHPTTAEVDGSYTLQTKDLEVPGTAAVIFQITQGAAREDLAGTLRVAGDQPKSDDKNSARQMGWWVLNFTVCIGFLMLLSRRRKAAAPD